MGSRFMNAEERQIASEILEFVSDGDDVERADGTNMRVRAESGFRSGLGPETWIVTLPDGTEYVAELTVRRK